MFITSLIVIFFFFLKVKTSIYCIQDYLSNRDIVDIQISIDDQIVLKDSVMDFPFTVINRKLKYGIHEIKVRSEKVDIEQTKRIFLLPYQYIIVEVLTPNTFNLAKEKLDSISIEQEVSTRTDSMQLVFGEMRITKREKPRFIIQTGFHPFSTR